MKNIRKILFIIPLIFAVVSAYNVVSSAEAQAVSGSDWRAGNIINDSLFYDNSSMSVEAIQAFLNSKVPNCDTQGNLSASDLGYPNMTHAEYAATRGWQGPPYICLKDYYQVPDSSQVISNFQGSVPSGAISAAQIIKIASDTYHVSPKVLLTTLQKESLNLIYDSWPRLCQYKNAMGYGCPDTAPCDPVYEGFYNQMMNAARQFNLYRTYPASYRYKPFQDNSILYNPSTVCGSSIVYVENLATAGLYNYTPYQPNQAALNNLYGTGDSCSAYGNRNFWRIFNDWFGSGFLENNQLYITSPISINKNPVIKGEPVAITYTVQNKSTTTMDTGVLWVCTSLKGKEYGSGSTRKTLAPDEYATVSMDFTPSESGTLTVTACGNTPNGNGFVEGYPNEIQFGYRKQSYKVNNNGITISSAVSTSKPLYKDIPNTISYVVKNMGQNAYDTGDLWVCTSLNGKPLGSRSYRKTLSPGEELLVSMPYTPSSTGSLNITACGNPPGGPGWVSGYPTRQYDDHGYIKQNVSKSPIVITSAIATNSKPMAGAPNTINYIVKNTSQLSVDTGDLWICTSLNGKPLGSSSYRKTLSPGEELLVSMPYTPSNTGSLDITACGNPPGGPGWVSGYPTRQYDDHGQRLYETSESPIVISAAVAATSTPKIGSPTLLYFQVKNRSAQSVDSGVLWICTYFNGVPYGSGAIRKTLSPGETMLVSMEYTPTSKGVLEISACGNYPNGPGWVSTYPTRDYKDHGSRVYYISQ